MACAEYSEKGFVIADTILMHWHGLCYLDSVGVRLAIERALKSFIADVKASNRAPALFSERHAESQPYIFIYALYHGV